MDTSANDALYARFLRGLGISPNGEAIRVGSEAVSYEAAHDMALCWAGSLLEVAPEPPQAVGVLAGNGVQAYIGVLTALYAGAAVVPLQPDFPIIRTRRMLGAAGVSALYVDDRGYAQLPELLGEDLDMPVLAAGRELGDAGPFRSILLDRRHALDGPRPVAIADTAYVLFTSGSTGAPKGVPITHGNTSHYFRLLDARYDFTPDDVFSQTFDLTFDCAMFDLFCAWGAGASLTRVPTLAYRDLPAFVAERGMTVWFSTPSTISLVRRTGGLGPSAMTGLRASFFAGEALKCQDAADWQAAAPNSIVENLYGPTELTVTVTAHRWLPDASPQLGVNGVVPIGSVHEGHHHLLIDSEGRPSDVEGELWVAGPQSTAGYLDPADNRDRFMERDGCTWYRTGDRVRRLRNRELVYLGRIDAQVQVRGWRVEPAEIDHAVRACQGVEDAVTVSTSINDATELVVFYTGVLTPPAEFVRQLRQTLPYGMIPTNYRHLDEFPRNTNQKIDRLRLQSRANELYHASMG